MRRKTTIDIIEAENGYIITTPGGDAVYIAEDIDGALKQITAIMANAKLSDDGGGQQKLSQAFIAPSAAAQMGPLNVSQMKAAYDMGFVHGKTLKDEDCSI